MSVYGNAAHWHDLLDSLVPDIVELILAAWQTMPHIPPDSKEDPVSLELCRQLRAQRALSELPLTVHTQTVELNDDAEVDDGRIDLTFHPLVPSEKIYFALECKRVNVLQWNGEVRRYFAEYVTHGLTRFVTRQYSRAVRHGGMLAFVLDGDVKTAIDGVLRMVIAKTNEISLCDVEIGPSRFAPKNELMRETIHSRSVEAGNVLVQHFFLAANTSAN